MAIKQETIDAAVKREFDAYQEKLTKQAQNDAAEAGLIQAMKDMEEVPADMTDEQVLALNRHVLDGYRMGENNLQRFKPGFLAGLMQAHTPFGLTIFFPPSFQQDFGRANTLVNRLMGEPKLPLGVTMPDITYAAPEGDDDEGAVVVTMITFTEDYEVVRQDVGGPGKTLLSAVIPGLSKIFNIAAVIIEEGKPVPQLVVPVESGQAGVGILNMDAFDEAGMPDQSRTSKLAFQYGPAQTQEAGAVHFHLVP